MLLRADWQVPQHVNAFNTTRLGGFSAPPYDSMNLGLHVNDEREAVLKNRRLLIDEESLPNEPHWLNQVHGCHVLNVSSQKDRTNSARHLCLLMLYTTEILPPIPMTPINGLPIFMA